MFKKILVSIAFSISMLNYPAYGEVINSENNMYKEYFNNGKINQKKILNELASEDIRFSGSGLKDFLLDKKNNISIEEVKQIINSLKNNTSNNFQNKLFFYFRYYQYLDDVLIKEIKNRFKDKNMLSDSYIESIIDFYSFIPEKDRKELIYNLMDNCNYCNKIPDLLSKDYNRELLEHYIYKVAPKSEQDTYKPQDLIVVLYDKLDQKLKEKLFDDIKERIVKKDILAYKNLFDFIYQNYSTIDQKYKSLIYYVAENSNDINFILYFDNLKNEKKELYNKIPVKDIDTLTVKYFDKFKKAYNLNLSDDSINNFRSIIFYYINNFKKLSQIQKRSFKEILSKLKNNTGLSYQVTQEYKNIDKDIKQLVFEKIISKEIDSSTTYSIFNNYSSFSKGEIEKLEKKVLEKGLKKELLYSIKNNYNNLPEDYKKNLLLKLSKNKVDQEGVFEVLLNNFDKLTKPLKELFFKLLNNKVGLNQAYSYTMTTNKNKEISNIVFANLSKISTQDLVVSFFDNIYNFDSETELIKKIINEIASRKDLKVEYTIYQEYEPYTVNIKEEIDENMYLFQENKIEIDKILILLPQTQTSKNNQQVSNEYYNFDLFLEDTSLSSEQRILVLNNFIKENKYLKQIAVLIIEDYKIFTEKQIKELIVNLTETKKLSNSYLGYLLFNQYKNLSLDTKNILINLIDSDPKSQVYLIASIISNFDDFPEKIRNKYIDKYLDKISDNKENRISPEEVMESLNDTELFPFQDDEEDNSEVNKILRTVAATTNISLKDYYMNILLLKNKSKLNNDQKIKFENILNNSGLIGSNDTLVYAITNYLVDLNVEERKKVLDTITSTKDGMYSLLNSIHHNSSESKLDLLNILYDKSEYSKRLMATQEILSDSYNKILNNPDFKDNPSYLTSFMFINDKYISESIKKLIDNGLIRAFNSNEKIDDFFNDIITRNDMLSTYSKDTLSDYLIKNKIILQSSIWFLANNYKDLKNKSQIRELLERELEKTASFMIYNYTSFEESDKFFDLISSNEKFSFITNLILLNNYKSFDKDKINKILEKSINNNEIDIPVIYTMVFNYNNLSEKLRIKLLELSKDKKYNYYILKGLAYNSDNISLKDKFNLINNLSSYITNKEDYSTFLVKNYADLDITRKNDFLEYTKDEKLRKIILEEALADNPKISQEQIISDVLKNKESSWNFLLASLKKDRFNKEFFKQKYPNQYQEIIKRLTEIYSEKIKKEKFDIESVFDQRHIEKKAIIYKNWSKLDKGLKEKFKNILFSENIDDSVGIIMARIDFNDETEETVEEFRFVKEMYKIIKSEIINNKKLDLALLDDLLSEPMIEKEFIELIISEIKKGKINGDYLDNNLGKVLNVYSDKESIIHITGELNNKVLLKNYLNEKLNLEAKKEFISDLFMSKNSNSEYIQYQNYLFTLDFLEKQKI